MRPNILDYSIDSLNLSDDFKLKAKKLGFKSIRQISSTEPKKMMEMEGFDLNWLGELVDFLKAEDQMDVLQKF